MARPLRIVFPSALYHVTARGQERRPLFADDSDRERMIEQLAKSLQRYQGRLYAYVLMSNHYHLLVETPGGNLSRLMQHLNTSYTVYFNRRHRRHGHLLEGRFQARVVEGTKYLLALTRYVHLNPVKTAARRSLPIEERVTCLRAYRWSSYRGFTGLGGAEGFIDYGPLTNLVAEGRRNKGQAYREFVESGLAGKDEELRAVLNLSSKAIGQQSFCREVEEWHQQRVAALPDPSSVARRRVEVGWKPEEILERVAAELAVDNDELQRQRRGDWRRWLTMKLLHEKGGLTQRAVGRMMGMKDGSEVSRYLRKLEEKAKTDAECRAEMIRLGNMLSS